jgi:hypothetical protein
MHYPSPVSNFASLIRATLSHKGRGTLRSAADAYFQSSSGVPKALFQTVRKRGNQE